MEQFKFLLTPLCFDTASLYFVFCCIYLVRYSRCVASIIRPGDNMSLHVRQAAMAEAEANGSPDDPPTLLSSSEEEDEEECEDDYREPISRRLRFSNESPALPANRGIGFPHIVMTNDFDEESDTSEVSFADGIATFLWNWDRVQFYKFFDMTKDKFEIHYDAPQGPIKDMIIWRNGDSVMAGFRVPGMYGDMEWDAQLVYSIEADGRWFGRICSEATRREAIEIFGESFSKAIFHHRLWDLRGSAKVKIHHA
ncbi:uncharacterized protein CLAFUR5_07217 [Fulvia fulva]|uniref:Uncharacterized protein n=1 Tax=Passalora fulva TaxID=5499 RepID=A0A9Q8PA66_PASFU|nr:uncharacterized protein CLAFUR5_07217 [Fulvia fulva]UJO18707.1 hypothetical protein CLAFUR5_07217 [Fulvia fulva]WPV30901.1 hypothetical protein CLAFUW7_07081 [Fulvia fulva]